MWPACSRTPPSGPAATRPADQALVRPGAATNPPAPRPPPPAAISPGDRARVADRRVDHDHVAGGLDRPAHLALCASASAGGASRLSSWRTPPGGMAAGPVAA